MAVLQRNGASPVFAQMQHALQAAEDEEDNVDQDGREDGGRNLGTVLGVLDAADHLMVVVLEQQAQDG